MASAFKTNAQGEGVSVPRGGWADAIYPAAQLFVERSLSSNSSFVTGIERVWTRESADDFYDRFVVNEDVGSASFTEKLVGQLAGANDETVLLAADLVCICTMPVYDIGLDAKLKRLRGVLGLLSPEPEIDNRILDALTTGIASYGAGRTVVWKHMRYMADFARVWVSLDARHRGRALADPWAWKEFLSGVSGGIGAQAAALLHMVFPEVFEPVVSTDVKTSIARTFAGVAGVPDEPDIDRKLMLVRSALAPALGETFQFWDTAVQSVWQGKPDDRSWEFAEFARKFRELSTFDEEEVDYKLELAGRLAAAREAVLMESPDWIDLLKNAFAAPNNITSWRDHVELMKWLDANPDIALANLRALWSAPSADEADPQPLLDAIPKEAIQGPGSRANLASYLFGAWDPYDWVNYKASYSERALTLCGLETADRSDVLDRIARFASFVDQLRVRVVALGGSAVSRLEAQGMAWFVTGDQVPVEWTDADKKSLETFRAGAVPPPPPPPPPPGKGGAAWYFRGYAFSDGTRVETRWLDGDFVGLGWSEAGFLETGSHRPQIRERVSEAFPDEKPGWCTAATKSLYSFLTVMNQGDFVVALLGSSVFIGRVTGDPTWKPDDDPWIARQRTVEWLNRDAPSSLENLSPSLRSSLKVPLSVSKISASEEVAALVGLAPVPEPVFLSLAPVTSDVADRVFFDVPDLQQMSDLLAEKRQLVFFGPPGTGKTLVAQVLAEHLTAAGGEWQLVQFHPSYAYEDFMEGYRPILSDDGAVSYELREGPFRRIAAAAMEDPGNPYILVVDEINRGNIPKIFGELLFLLEYRDVPISLQYSDQHFILPPNIFVIGTMNTADRSIALVDAALRRRFYFVPFVPSEAPVKHVLRRWLAKHGRAERAALLLDALNEKIAKDQMAIGPSYLMAGADDDETLRRIWRYAILPLLEEHYYGTKHDVEKEFGFDACLAAISLPPIDGREAPPEALVEMTSTLDVTIEPAQDGA